MPPISHRMGTRSKDADAWQWGNGFGPVWAACVGVGFHELGSLGATKKWIWVWTVWTTLC